MPNADVFAEGECKPKGRELILTSAIAELGQRFPLNAGGTRGTLPKGFLRMT